MIIYNPEKMIKERIAEAERILSKIPAKYCFITGSFLYKEKYNDIDVFVVSRTKKKIKIENKKIKITFIDFNDLYSLFYSSATKKCIAKNILPVRKLKVTVADFWNVVNEAVPTLLNDKNKFHKNVRNLIVYTEYFKNGVVFDSFQLDDKVKSFKDYKEILKYIEENVPFAINFNVKKSYIKRFFYTQAGYYKKVDYDAQKYLYNLSHMVTRYEG